MDALGGVRTIVIQVALCGDIWWWSYAVITIVCLINQTFSPPRILTPNSARWLVRQR
jgi:hypothetical protein